MTIETRPGTPAQHPDATPAAGPSPGDAAPSRGAAPSPDRRITLARAVISIVTRLIPEDSGLTVALDGDPAPELPSPGGRRAHVRMHGPDAVSRVTLVPSETSFSDGYLRGDLDIDGDVALAVEAARRLDPRRLTPADARRLLRYGLELRRDRGSAPEIRRLPDLKGQPHSRARDMAAIRFHYDVGEPFYRLWLDRRLTYSCGYFERDADPSGDLDAAQEAKLDLVCRKLDLRPGQRLLDIGCGWGSLILHAAERYKVEAIGVTLSERQATEANRRAALMGLEHRVRAETRDYRDLAALGAFDAVASIGMFEHVGAANLVPYFEAAREALVPGGRFLNHGIATNRPAPRTAGLRANSGFVDRYVFPDGELVPVERAIEIARDRAGFELLDVGLLRPHYALTLQAWVSRLEAHWPEAVEAAGEEVARTWRLYMSAARVGFEQGDLDVAQLLLAKPAGVGVPAPRPLRPWWSSLGA
jgi:cyclopropane-fatty-acyl-phospholipid synthase